MGQPFWDAGATPGFGLQAQFVTTIDPATGKATGAIISASGNNDCLLPDIAFQEQLKAPWAWDVIYLAGRRAPGLAVVKFGREHRVNAREANGADGAQTTSLGYRTADIDIKLRLWTPQQLADFESITIPSIQPRPGKPGAGPRSVQVQYPSLAMWGITKLFVTKVSGPVPSSVPQLWEVSITATEINPLKQMGTATQKSGGVAVIPNQATGAKAPPSAATPGRQEESAPRCER